MMEESLTQSQNDSMQQLLCRIHCIVVMKTSNIGRRNDHTMKISAKNVAKLDIGLKLAEVVQQLHIKILVLHQLLMEI